MSPVRKPQWRRPAWPARIALTAAALLAVIAAACGGGGSQPEAAPDDASPFAPAVPELPAIADPRDVPLTPVTSATNTYTIDIPAGWTQKGIGITQEETWQLMNGQYLAAEIAVTCEPVPKKPTGAPWTVADFVDRDQTIISGPLSPQGVSQFELTVAGQPATGVSYTVNVANIAIRQQAVYVIQGGCAWIIRLRVFGAGDASAYAELFGRVVVSFKPTQG